MYCAHFKSVRQILILKLASESVYGILAMTPYCLFKASWAASTSQIQYKNQFYHDAFCQYLRLYQP